MGKVLAIIVVVAGLAAGAFGIYYYFLSQKPNAGLKIETNPTATVFVDGVQVGLTPIDRLYKPGEVSIKIIPNSTTANLTSYQTKVHLTAGTYTVIRRDFAGTDAATAGETVSLESTTSKNASLAVVAAGPDAASVIMDGEPLGFTPLPVDNIAPGDHQITVSAPGFTARPIDALAVAGHKLVINVKLAGEEVAAAPPILDFSDSTPSATLKPSPTPSPSSTVVMKKPYVEIKVTPTGFLRVRDLPSASSKELGQVKPGDKLPLLGSQSGWYQVSGTFTATTSGWLSGQYADKFE